VCVRKSKRERGVASFIDDNLISDTRHDIIKLPAQYKRIMHFHFRERIYHTSERESRRGSEQADDYNVKDLFI
jgi:hypothetical protein